MRAPGLITLGFIIAICFMTTSALALEIIYPADKTLVRRSDFLVLKGGNSPVLEEMIIDINGDASDPLDISTEEYKAAFADFLILEPSWTAGKNSIAVKGLVGGKVVVTANAEFYFNSHADPVAVTPPGFQPFIMHTPAKESLCQPCHNMQPTDAQLKGASSADNPCASCHARMFSQEYVHGPEGVFQCIDCHDSKSKPQRWQILKPELELCTECHDDKVSEFKKRAFVHGPVAIGNCIPCHNPHAAAEPFQLNASTNTLCGGCHSTIKQGGHVVRAVGGSKGHPLAGVNDPLRPGRKLSCASCHSPHSGENAALFVRGITNRFSLCQECHKK